MNSLRSLWVRPASDRRTSTPPGSLLGELDLVHVSACDQEIVAITRLGLLDQAKGSAAFPGHDLWMILPETSGRPHNARRT